MSTFFLTLIVQSRIDWQANAVEALKNSSGVFSRLAASASKIPTATFCVDEYRQVCKILGFVALEVD